MSNSIKYQKDTKAYFIMHKAKNAKLIVIKSVLSQIKFYLVSSIIIWDLISDCSILSRITGKEFKDSYDATVGVEFGNFILEIEGKMIKMQIWDTAGMESFRSITRIFYRDAHLVCVVYDITKEDSFDHIDDWDQEIENNADKDTLIYLIGKAFTLK